MPADYHSAAAALSIPTSLLSPSPSSVPSPNAGSVPPWARPSTTSGSRRLSSRPYTLHQSSTTLSSSSQPQSWTAQVSQVLHSIQTLNRHLYTLFLSLSPLRRGAILLALALVLALGILALTFSHTIFSLLSPLAQTWRQLPYGLGWLSIFLFTFLSAFPPVIGYSTAVTLAGFVYGFPLGWPIVASANVLGSIAAFRTSRGIFSGYVHGLVGQDRRFRALAYVLKQDGLWTLVLIRLCPLPYSISNGFLSTIPSIGMRTFGAATALATPKLLVHVFIGSRLALLAEEGDKMSARDRAINLASMIIGALLGFVMGLVIYRRTMARAEELAREEGDDVNGGLLTTTGEEGAGDHLEEGAGMVDPDDAALTMDDDDISLWEAEGAGERRYRDSWDEEAGVGVGVGVQRNGNGKVMMNGKS